jgi:cytochrome c-type biogenesis protein CcmF
LYIVLGAFDAGTQSVTLQIFVNALVNWIWLGFGLMAFGTGIALLPERALSFALARLPAEAVTTAVLLLALVLGSASTVSAQHMPGATGGITENVQTSHYARTDFERQLQKEIVCTCGACGHAAIGECRKDPCPVSHQMRSELAAYIDEGKSHDEIIQAFVTKYDSQEMLGAPLDKGFNRLAWLFPYLLGAGGVVAIGFAAVRWSRKGDVGPDSNNEGTDPALNERLDDELRDLD